MNSDDEQRQISPAHLERDDPSPSAVPRRAQLGDQTPRAFQDASRELSGSRLPYTFEGLERDGIDRRDDGALAAALNDPRAEILPVWRRRVLMSDDGESLLQWPKEQLTDKDTVVFLGTKTACRTLPLMYPASKPRTVKRRTLRGRRAGRLSIRG